MPRLNLVLRVFLLAIITQDVLAYLDKEVDQKCSCTFDYENSFVKARVGNRMLERGDIIKQGETVSFECRYVNMVLEWKNGLRFFGRAEMTCSTCEKWQGRHLPTCKSSMKIKAVLGQDDDLAVLPGGIIQVRKGETRKFFCSNVWKQPQWKYLEKEGVSETKIENIGQGETIYVSYLNIMNAKNEHSGKYECFTKSNTGHRIVPTFLHLKVIENEEGGIIATTQKITTSQRGDIKPTISVEPSSPQTTDVTSDGDCPCTLNYEDPSVKVQLGHKILKQGNTIKLDETVSLGCKNDNEILEWQNGFRFQGNVSMTCSTCKTWQKDDIPTCSRPTRGTYISYYENLKILPGGIIDVPIGEYQQFPCISSYDRPQWDFGGRPNVATVQSKSFRDGTIFYISRLDIVEVAVRNNGTYRCFLRGEFGTMHEFSYLHLQVKEREDRSISTPQPRMTSSSSPSTQPNIYVEPSSQDPLSDCCIYESESQVVNAQIGNKILNFGDRIRQGEKVSFECKIEGMALTWKNGLRLYGKVNMTCNTCKKWQEKDAPVCKIIERDTVISNDKALNLLPGGIVTIQKGKRHQFSCISTWREPEWDFGEREGVYVTKTPLSGSGNVLYISYLDIDEVDQADGEYECYMNFRGRRVGSSFLHLQSNDYASCPEFPNSPGLQVTYSNDVSVGSIATFRCSLSTRHLNGSNFSECLRSRSWSNPLPSCEDPKCSIFDLVRSIPEDVMLDIQDETQEYVTFGSEVRLMCSHNSVMTGDSKAQCGEQGQWILGKFECVVGCLLNLDPSSHLIVQPIKDSYRVGEFIYTSCPPGEEMSSKVERLMCLPGFWSDDLPECKKSKKEGRR